ncbi:MAG TPA: hypothetical protein VMZ26_17505 [Pyrinomonadaceae bacterium]|nr:hypothetical protein [Pyrinomonadaceae bacterium]
MSLDELQTRLTTDATDATVPTSVTGTDVANKRALDVAIVAGGGSTVGLATEATLLEVRDAVDSLEAFTDGIEGLLTATNVLLTAVNASIDQLEGYSDGLEGLLTSIRDATDGLEGFVDGLEGFVDGLETLVASANASLTSIDGKLTDVATATKQDTGNASLSSIDTKLSSQATAANQTTGNASLASLDGKFSSLGQKTMSASAPVVIASDQSALPSSQSGTWNITNVSGTVSLPTGASTAALQTTGNTSLSSIDGKLNSLGQKTSANSVPVVIASDQTVTIASASSSAGAVTVVSASTSSVTLITANASRKALSLFNNSNKTAYVRFQASAASTSAFTIKMNPDDFFTPAFTYTGEIRAIWDGSSGDMQITEFT